MIKKAARLAGFLWVLTMATSMFITLYGFFHLLQSYHHSHDRFKMPYHPNGRLDHSDFFLKKADMEEKTDTEENFPMLDNYFKVSFRNKLSSYINVFELAIGFIFWFTLRAMV